MNKDNKRHISSLDNGENNIEDKLDAVAGGNGYMEVTSGEDLTAIYLGKCPLCGSSVESKFDGVCECNNCNMIFKYKIY